MRALVFAPSGGPYPPDENGNLRLTELPIPSRPGECLIRVRLAGICGTDLEILGGYAGFRGVPGHEFVGIVERAPADDARWVGRRVVGEINVGCGDCRFCREGVREHCERRTVAGIRGRDGAFAEYLTLPAANLHDVSDAIPDEGAVFAEPLAAACRVAAQLDLAGPRDVAVAGDGRLGLLVAQVLAHAGSRVTVVGRHPDKLAVARALGVETLDGSAAGRARSRFDVVVDATGRRSGLETALALVRPRGTVVLKSTFHGAVPLATWPIVVDEVTIVGSRCGPFDTALELLASGAVNVTPLVTAVHPLDEWQQAFDAARTGLKVLIRFSA
jgi:2-desacetyl-2-hydroxyethyl bacteriochlorophyllide A dehydrogenase